jgi:hypothetical protein
MDKRPPGTTKIQEYISIHIGKMTTVSFPDKNGRTADALEGPDGRVDPAGKILLSFGK